MPEAEGPPHRRRARDSHHHRNLPRSATATPLALRTVEKTQVNVRFVGWSAIATGTRHSLRVHVARTSLVWTTSARSLNVLSMTDSA